MRRYVIALLIALVLLPTASWGGTVALTVPTSGNMTSSIGNTQVRQWAHLTSTNPTGAAWDTHKFSTLEVQIKGTWDGTPGTLTIQGSNDNSNWVTLTGLPAGVPTTISYSADPSNTLPVWETPNYIKAVLAGAGATTDVTVTVTGRN